MQNSNQLSGAAHAVRVSTTDERAAALEFLSGLAADLSRGPVDLPCFPNVVIKIRDALNNPNTTMEETVRLVGSEPRLTASLMQTANSAALNHSGKRITELKLAITRLGQQLVQGAAMAFAVRQMKDEPKLRSISKPLRELWQESIAVASISQVVSRRTKVRSDEAFLTGLLHGIGRLYIMAHAVDQPGEVSASLAGSDLIAGWHPSIGKAVLENWGMEDAIAEAVSEQFDYDRAPRRDADLTDILIVSVVLADTLGQPAPRQISMEEVSSFSRIGMSLDDCNATLTHAEYQLGSLQEALGC
jgi:HD-like signal output (HDOD) protein